MDAFISGGWRKSARAEIYINGAWRRISRGEAVLSSAWRSIVTFIPPMSLAANSPVYGYRGGSKPITGVVISDPTIATPTGGSGPYRYAWAQISGNSITIASPSTAFTTFSTTVPAGQERNAIVRVTCTDSLGTVATADVSVILSNNSGFLE